MTKERELILFDKIKEEIVRETKTERKERNGYKIWNFFLQTMGNAFIEEKKYEELKDLTAEEEGIKHTEIIAEYYEEYKRRK